MKEVECLSNLLQVCTRKTEEFARTVEDKYVVWLLEIEEEAKKMFSSDFNAEPELMPKTPSQKRRRKKRISIVADENQDHKTRRISRRKSSSSWSTSVRRLSTKYQNKPINTFIKELEEQPKRVTRAQASIAHLLAPEKTLPEMAASPVLQVNLTAKDRESAEVHMSDLVSLGAAPPAVKPEETVSKQTEPPKTPDTNGRSVGKLKLAHSSTPKPLLANPETIDLTVASPQPVTEPEKEQKLDLSDAYSTPTGSRSDRRSVRRSLARQSTSQHTSLVSKYSLASKRESMTREAVRKSIRRSISKKKAVDSSSSSYKSYQSSIEVVDEEVTIKTRTKNEPSSPVSEVPAPESPSPSLRTRGFKKIAISNLPDSGCPQRVTRSSLAAEKETETLNMDSDDAQVVRRKSYKRAVDELSDDEQPGETELHSPPRKKTPSPTCPPSKVVKPPPHMKSFLHTVQKNQLLMMTPGSIGKSIMVKSFIKRTTPLKTDLKEKERLRQEALRKKEEAEIQRKQKIEEGKKRKQEELKIRRDERLRKVLQARERVEQLEEEKKKKIEQKFAQIDEKSEKVREDRLAEEKAKKKVTAKKLEEAENRRRQEEETRKLKTKQLQEEEERKHQEQKKRDEEELERQRKMAEAKKLAEQRQAELEREKQREQQLAAEEQERLRAERERVEKERALQLQKELQHAAQEKERQRMEAEERKKQRLEQERLEKLKEEASKTQVIQPHTLNVTVDISNSPACESYEMTPKSYKLPSTKINTETYGMDLNSDDSTDDESMPRKPIPAWASGNQLSQAIRQQYYNPIDVDSLFGVIENPKLEDIFNKSKPRYFKRTSSAVWHSPPMSTTRQQLAVSYGLKKY